MRWLTGAHEKNIDLELDADGAGLGLAIVRDIARLHRAEVSLQERAGKSG